MRELGKLYEGLTNSNVMLLREVNNALECSFVKVGIVHEVVVVKDEVLSEELRNTAELGILEGAGLQHFRNTFDSFVLHVKAKRLYLELRFSLKAGKETPQNKVYAA
ncbi:hypothetical protein [Botryobacter ruber]|uniref:hypothetical protein n=1 Tax=Botryobacter ruber TaxID=2171629 RepID=UPI000E0B3E51|nr:hypothetical protein [Botryobacter ruber]